MGLYVLHVKLSSPSRQGCEGELNFTEYDFTEYEARGARVNSILHVKHISPRDVLISDLLTLAYILWAVSLSVFANHHVLNSLKIHVA